MATKKPEQLSLILKPWGDDKRAESVHFARSALFNCSREKRKTYSATDPLEVMTIGKFQIYYSGDELRVSEEDVFLQLIHYGRKTPIGEWFSFTRAELLKDLGLNNCPTNYALIKDSIARLAGGNVVVYIQRYDLKDPDSEGYLIESFNAHLIYTKSLEGKEQAGWSVRFDPSLSNLYQHPNYLDWEKRKTLTAAAKRVYGYFASHSEPYPIHMDVLLALCGLKTDQKAFKKRQTIKGIMDQLEQAQILSYGINKDDVVSVTRLFPKE